MKKRIGETGRAVVVVVVVVIIVIFVVCKAHQHAYHLQASLK
jgi:hypothetical protein